MIMILAFVMVAQFFFVLALCKSASQPTPKNNRLTNSRS